MVKISKAKVLGILKQCNVRAMVYLIEKGKSMEVFKTAADIREIAFAQDCDQISSLVAGYPDNEKVEWEN